jgi:hypothetical protein
MRQRAFHVLVVFSFILIGCKGEQGPPGPAGPTLSGNIQGYVRLYNEHGIPVSNRSGVSVSLEGTAYNSTSDSTGKWVLINVPAGIYTAVLRKVGYFDARMEGFQFVGGGTLSTWPLDMADVPTFTVPSIMASTSVPSQTITVSGTVSSPSPSQRAVLIFYGRTASVSYAEGSYSFAEEAAAYSNSTGFIRISSMDSTQRATYGFFTGQHIYIRAYPCSWMGPHLQTNLATGKLVPTWFGTSPSPLDSAVVP